MSRRILRPGSFAWLVAHDLRLAWRGFAEVLGRLGERGAPLVVVLAIALVHLAAWPLAIFLGRVLEAATLRGEVEALIAAALASGLMWTTSQALVATTRALFIRSDLELLLASPLPVARILAARAVAIAMSSAGSVALIVLPIAHMGAALGQPAWLAAWPALMVLGLVGTGLGLMLAIGIFLAVGRRRARLVANLAATFIAGGFVLGVQAWLLLPPDVQEAVRGWLQARSAASLARPDGILSLLAGAARGEPAAVMLVVAVAVGLFAAAVALLSGVFARAVAASAGAASGPARQRSAEHGLGFKAGAGAALRRKEWRLLLRDPSTFSQLALQIIYTVPVAVVLARSGQDLPTGLAVAPAIVVIAAQIAASLAWLTVSGEDAPELIRTAPVPRPAVERAKLGAMAVPVAVVLAVPLAGLALLSPLVALATAAVSLLAASSTALLNLWHPMPGNRRGMLRRHSQSKLVGLLEHALAMLWAITVVFVLFASWYALVPIALVVAILAGAAPVGVDARTCLGRLLARRACVDPAKPATAPRS